MKRINGKALGFHHAYFCGEKLNSYHINGYPMGGVLMFFSQSQRPLIRRFMDVGYTISAFTATPGALAVNPNSPKYNIIMCKANKPPIELRGNNLAKLITELRVKELEVVEKKPRRRYC